MTLNPVTDELLLMSRNLEDFIPRTLKVNVTPSKSSYVPFFQVELGEVHIFHPMWGPKLPLLKESMKELAIACSHKPR